MVSVDLGEFLTRILDATAAQLKHLRRPKSRVEQLKNAIAELRAKAADIDSSIRLAQLERKIPSEQVQLWMSEVKELEGKAAAIEHDFERRRCLDGCSWNCFSVNRRVATRIEEIDKLVTRADATMVATNPLPPAVVPIPTSNSGLPIEKYMTEILSHIASASIGVIGIYGMGGVGKTTLLTSINNHRDVAAFDHVIWAVASKECKMERLQMDIAKRLKLHLEKDDNQEDLAAELFDFLKNKDCLLLLDDVWAPFDPAKLGMVRASSGQEEHQKRKVVVFTTRDEEVCDKMKVSKKIEIKCLAPDQAWELFRKNAGEYAIGSDAGINRIAHQISQECAGLPLALVTVGTAMSTKKSWEAWNDALTLMKQSQMPKVTGKQKEDRMFSAFKLSYDNLEDDEIRGCLLSCALWPEDHSIEKEDLIECWMGLGLIHEVETLKAYNLGYSYIETLKAACLLEPGHDKESEVKVHDVIRDMALWMASDCGVNKFKWIVRTEGTESQALEEAARHEAERVSLMYNRVTSLPNQLSTCSKLSVLVLRYNRDLSDISGSLILAMCALTFLDLEGTAVKEIPKEIGMLLEIRYLNFSRTLIQNLPVELGFLVKLNYLILRCAFYLTTVAKGAISNLSSLKLLDLRGSECKIFWDELESSKGCQISIGVYIIRAADLQRLSSLAHVSTWRLRLSQLYDSTNLAQHLDDIMRSRNIGQSIEQLIIFSVNMDKLLISKGNEEARGFEALKNLQLAHLYMLEEIMWKGVQPQIVFPNLRKLGIYYCKRLRNVNYALQLPSLSFLDVGGCNAMEELISDKGDSSSSSFNLSRMRLWEMEKLERISSRPLEFPYLEEIGVLKCPFLRKLPFDNRICVNNRLKVIRCEQTWWDNLEWEEVNIKNSLLPLCEKPDDKQFYLGVGWW